jgi:hypothetical protein
VEGAAPGHAAVRARAQARFPEGQAAPNGERLVEHRAQVRRRKRAREDVALDGVKPQLSQALELFPGLDAFRDELDPEIRRELQDIPNDALRSLGFADRPAELLIDLHLLNGKSFRYASDEKPVPKSSSAMPMPHRPQLLDDGQRRLRVLDQHRFGHLQLQAPGRQPGSSRASLTVDTSSRPRRTARRKGSRPP